MPRKFHSIRTEGNAVFRTEGPRWPGQQLWHPPDGVVRGAADHEAVPVLQAGDAALVPVQRPHELARAGAPHLGTRDKLPEAAANCASSTSETTRNSQTEGPEAHRGGETHRASSEAESRAQAPVGTSRDRGTGTAVALRRAGDCI